MASISFINFSLIHKSDKEPKFNIFLGAVIINGVFDSDCDEIFGCSFEDPSDYIKIDIKATIDNVSVGIYRMMVQIPEEIYSTPISGYVTGASFELRF